MVRLPETIQAAQAWLDNDEGDVLAGLNPQERSIVLWSVGHGSDADIPIAARPALAQVCAAIGTSR